MMVIDLIRRHQVFRFLKKRLRQKRVAFSIASYIVLPSSSLARNTWLRLHLFSCRDAKWPSHVCASFLSIRWSSNSRLFSAWIIKCRSKKSSFSIVFYSRISDITCSVEKGDKELNNNTGKLRNIEYWTKKKKSLFITRPSLSQFWSLKISVDRCWMKFVHLQRSNCEKVGRVRKKRTIRFCNLIRAAALKSKHLGTLI